MELKYYPDHAERYKHLKGRQRLEFPDEVWLMLIDDIPFEIIKREKNLNDMTAEDMKRYGADAVLLAAKDVPISKCYYDGGS